MLSFQTVSTALKTGLWLFIMKMKYNLAVRKESPDDWKGDEKRLFENEHLHFCLDWILRRKMKMFLCAPITQIIYHIDDHHPRHLMLQFNSTYEIKPTFWQFETPIPVYVVYHRLANDTCATSSKWCEDPMMPGQLHPNNVSVWDVNIVTET